MLEETFEQYTERRIKTYDGMKNIFPEHFEMENVDHLRNAYKFQNHLEIFKSKMEKILNLKLSWDAVDSIYKQIQNIASQKVHEKYTIEELSQINTFEKFVEYSIECRKEFMKLIGENFTEDLKNSFRTAFLNDVSNKTNWLYSMNNILINKQLKDMKDE